jgi:hypothetical protein
VPVAASFGREGSLPCPPPPMIPWAVPLGNGPVVGFGQVDEVHPFLLLGPLAGDSLAGPAHGLPAQRSGPREVAGSAHRSHFKAMWLSRGCRDPSLGF